MLHKSPNIIFPQTLELLQDLHADPQLGSYFLVGGTSLALQIGHRLSVDLDLFSLSSFEVEPLENYLVGKYNFEVDKKGANTLIGSISGIKTDFITHAYPLVKPLLLEENLRMASATDIAAMKLNAISQSGQRLKDFVDIYFLLEIMPLSLMLDAYEVKYPNSNLAIPLKAVVYFDEIDFEADAPIMVKKMTVPNMKKRLTNAVKKPFSTF